ncbi:Glycosyltransferase [Hyella patelloides LEGE 07179]|uniref:Glycosyltransferase n=1 Tax=Hyella patelloides LEGE 07179 TaxID=945734 RepID=A0A563VX96_9CYAN|nr:glycosyltransferase [Hyella patelloides]VEP16050.1 Glycosyltransferase [Hyella patelloides LEGE 07179]
MYIALIAHYLGPRLGIGQYLERLLPSLVEELTHQGFKVIILASPNAVTQTPALEKLKHLVRLLPPLDYSPVKRATWVITRLAKYCHREKIETIVWLSNPIVLPWHPPTIAVIHDVNEWKAANKYGDRLKTWLRAMVYLDASLRFAQQIIVVSEATKQDLCHFRPDPQLKLKLKAIANGNDSQLSDLAPMTIPAPNSPFLLSVGRIDPAAKRLPEAVALVSALREISHEPWELHLLGGINTTTQASGEAFLESIKNKHWVHYQGYVSDRALAQWYRQATAIVFLSENEGFGLPIAEAAAMNRWIVVSQTNQASCEVGENAVIPITATNPQMAAKKLLERLQKSPSPPTEARGQSWRETASAYAAEICRLTGFAE